MCSGAQGSVSDLERGGGGGGAEVVSTYTEELQGEQEAGSWVFFTGVSQMSAPSPALHSEVRLEYHTVHRAQYFSSQTSGPANLAFSQCFPSPWMPPVPQTSASRSLGITCRPYPRHTSQAPLVQFTSVVQSCPTLCDPMNHSTPGLPVHHQLPESTQTHVHQVDDAIQPSHSRSSPSPPALILSQHQGLLQWVSSSH